MSCKNIPFQMQTRRFVLIDGSTVQVPAAKGTRHRLHMMTDAFSDNSEASSTPR